jgi:hypothetical protein
LGLAPTTEIIFMVLESGDKANKRVLIKIREKENHSDKD